MRVVVTGGAGFIGSHLCERLLADGAEVVCVDNLLTGRAENVAHLAGPRFTFHGYDVSRSLDIRGPVDGVLHLASPASPADYQAHPTETLRAGALATWMALDLARERAARFVLASTSEVYGDPEVSPQPEAYWGHVNPIGPRSCYDEAKRFAEALTMAYHREHGVNTAIVRVFNSFGPRMRPDDGRVVPSFVARALRGQPLTVYGDGSQTRSFCFVADLVEGFVRMLRAGVHDPVNLGNPEETRIIDFARLVLDLTGSRSGIVYKPLPVDDPRRRCPDIGRARRFLDWSPRVPMREGLRLTLEWFAARISGGSS